MPGVLSGPLSDMENSTNLGQRLGLWDLTHQLSKHVTLSKSLGLLNLSFVKWGNVCATCTTRLLSSLRRYMKWPQKLQRIL